MELAEHVVHNPFLVLHREHPDTEVLSLILFTEFLTGKPKKGQGNLVPVCLMVVFGDCHSLRIKKRGIGHVNRNLQPIFMGKPLLGLENIQRFGQKFLVSNILLFAVSCDGCRILWNHLRTVDYIKNKFTHFQNTPIIVIGHNTRASPVGFGKHMVVSRLIIYPACMPACAGKHAGHP